MRPPEHSNRLWRLVESPIFTGFILVVIVANAVVLGLQTYDEVESKHGDTLNLLNDVFLGIFVVELALRIGCLRPSPAGLLPLRLERLRLRRDRLRVRPGRARELDAAADRTPAAGGASCADPPRPQDPRHRRHPFPAAAREHAAPDDGPPLHLRHARLAAVRGGDPAGLGQHRPSDAEPVRAAHARGLPALHGAWHGGAPVVVDLLRDLRPDHGLHRHQRPDRNRADLDGGGPGAGAPPPAVLRPRTASRRCSSRPRSWSESQSCEPR